MLSRPELSLHKNRAGDAFLEHLLNPKTTSTLLNLHFPPVVVGFVVVVSTVVVVVVVAAAAAAAAATAPDAAPDAPVLCFVLERDGSAFWRYCQNLGVSMIKTVDDPSDWGKT